MIALLGYGKTNQSLLKFLNANNQPCLIFDDLFCEVKEDERGNRFLPSSHKRRGDCHLEIPSPGIPPYHSLIQNSSNLISEYDFLLDEKKCQIWISGTNGKTTTTEILSWILRDLGGMSGGNIGLPLADLLALDPKVWILETSSFTLHYTQKAFPTIYLLLPIREDHISWHGSFENYTKAKLKVLGCMGSQNVALIPKEFENLQEVRSSKAQLIFYQESQDLARHFGFNLEKIGFNEPFLLDALIALGGAKILCHRDLSAKLDGFNIGRHKIEEFLDDLGRTWVDDSKGTNVDATIHALRVYSHRKVYLILGGDDKGADLDPLFEEMVGKDIEIFGIGSNVLRLQENANRYGLPFRACFELEKAVKAIHLVHSHQSIAILSPAAASLDQFASYKQRGEEFRKFIEVEAKHCKL